MLTRFSRSRGRCLRFGGFELCERPLALRRQHASVELTAQPLRLLNLLASNAGRTVTHDEIRAALWEGRTVSYSGSTHVIIRQIRAALGDDADAPRFIETTPREGYRFVAPVTVRSGDWLLPACVAASAVIAALAVAGLTWQSHSPLVAETSEAVRLGEYLLAQEDPDATRRALQRFEAGIEDQPDDRRALNGAGRAALLLQDYDRAAVYASRALALADSDAAALEIRGHVAMMRDRDWEGARQDFERVLSLDPDFAPAHHSMAALLILAGEHEAALDHMNAARRIDPASTLIRADLGWMQYYAGRYADATATCEAASQIHPDMTTFRYCVIRAQDEDGNTAPALPHIDWLMQLSQADAREIESVRMAADPIGSFDQWRYDRYRAPDRAGPVPLAVLAMTGMLAGDTDAALDWLQMAANQGDPGAAFIVIDPAFANLAGHPQFEILRAQLTPRGSQATQITDWSGLRAAPSR